MASSRKRRSSDLVERVGAELVRHVPRGARLTLALSGGVDSIALLERLAALAPRRALALDCLHVDRGVARMRRIGRVWRVAAADSTGSVAR